MIVAQNRKMALMKINDLTTPDLILDRPRMVANVQKMIDKADSMGVALRPHLKTAKSARVAQHLTDNSRFGITVSTLKEAEYFADNGAKDILYGVGIAPGRLDQAAALLERGVDLKIILDTEDAAQAVARHGAPFQVLIEIDCGDNRAGIAPDSDELISIAAIIAAAPNSTLRGVMTHAGHSYGVNSIAQFEQVAEDERLAVVAAADRLRHAGHTIDMVSAGSTPTALFTRNTEGLTELRAGVYVFFDLDQQSRGACERENIALSVLATVIGHNKGAGKILLDTGGLALSKDTGAKTFRPEVGYGEVCHAETAEPYPDLYVTSVSQEHGHVKVRDSSDFDALPIGTKVRILPNHACMTAAAYNSYAIVEGDRITDRWDRVNGW